MEWAAVETAFRGIFERRYFANNGPLVRELDESLARAAGARFAVAVASGALGLAIVAKALELRGRVIVPALGSARLAGALAWAGCSPVLCDVDPQTYGLTAELARPLVDAQTSAIACLERWGRASEAAGLRALAAERDLRLFVDALDASPAAARAPGTFAQPHVVATGGGASILTDDEPLSLILRTMRNFHPGETFAPVALRVNGKMSEAQAAFGLLELVAPAAANAEVFAVESADAARRDAIVAALADDGVHATVPEPCVDPERFPVAGRLARTLIVLPSAARTAFERLRQ